jgi:hypothetical protein
MITVQKRKHGCRRKIKSPSIRCEKAASPAPTNELAHHIICTQIELASTTRAVFRVRCFRPLSHLSKPLQLISPSRKCGTVFCNCYRTCYRKLSFASAGAVYSRLECRVETQSGVFLHGFSDVAVDVQCGRDRRMAKPSLSDLGMDQGARDSSFPIVTRIAGNGPLMAILYFTNPTLGVERLAEQVPSVPPALQ